MQEIDNDKENSQLESNIPPEAILTEDIIVHNLQALPDTSQYNVEDEILLNNSNTPCTSKVCGKDA